MLPKLVSLPYAIKSEESCLKADIPSYAKTLPPPRMDPERVVCDRGWPQHCHFMGA